MMRKYFEQCNYTEEQIYELISMIKSRASIHLLGGKTEEEIAKDKAKRELYNVDEEICIIIPKNHLVRVEGAIRDRNRFLKEPQPNDKRVYKGKIKYRVLQ